YHQALALSPDYPPAFSALAVAYIQLNDHTQAVKWAQKYLKVSPDGKYAGIYRDYLQKRGVR
ncbi:MAG: tetratricopeptide repeat protein, partial [Planctomycetota bacterium]